LVEEGNELELPNLTIEENVQNDSDSCSEDKAEEYDEFASDDEHDDNSDEEEEES